MKTLPLIAFAAALLTTGCDKQHLSFLTSGAVTPAHTIPGGLYVVMGQSNADRMYRYAAADLLSGLQTKAVGQVDIVNCAVGGSSLSSWAPGAVNYTNCVEAAKATGKPLSGILFWQGEAEAESLDEMPADQWGMNFTAVMTYFRQEFKAPAARVAYARLCRRNKDLPNLTAVVSSQESVMILNGEMVNVDDVTVLDGLHYSPEGYQVLAKKFVTAF